VGYIVEQFVQTADLLKRGWSDGDFVELGQAVMRGLQFPATVDVILLVRRELYPTPGLWHYCGQTEVAESLIQNADGYPHEAEMGYQYAAAMCHPNGFRSRFSQPVRVDFDDEGALITPAMPMWPLNVKATAIADGKYTITWAYEPWGQGAWPTDFQVFAGLPMDYDTPLTDSVTSLDYAPYVAGQQAFSFTTGAYGDGVGKVFAARARNSAGTAEQNMFTTNSRRARATGPAAGVIRSVVQRRI